MVDTSKIRLPRVLWILLCTVPIILYILYSNSSPVNNQISSVLKIENHTKKIQNNDRLKCQPILDRKQFRINIDGHFYPQIIQNYMNDSINYKCLNSNSKKKTILFWNTYFGSKLWSYEGMDPFKRKKCPVTNCQVTDDKQRVSEADYVIIHMRDPISTTFPKYRPAFQRWIFLLYESPVHAANFKKYNNFFNLTSTYRFDSDFPHFYTGSKVMKWQHRKVNHTQLNFYDKKKKFAAALISNCNKGRLSYIEKMSNYRNVDIFGGCGKKCPPYHSDCIYYLGTKYKFYLAFENSICEDYITEKFYRSLELNAIPVVRGGGTYEHYVPRSGYINSADFKSPKDLVDYMSYLDKNVTAYNSYFKWKENIVFEDQIGLFEICQMCVQLNLEVHFGIKKSVVEDVGELWSKKKCKPYDN